MTLLGNNEALNILEQDTFIRHLRQFPELRKGARFAAIPASQAIPFGFVELCKKMGLEPGAFPYGLASSYQQEKSRDIFQKQLEFLLQKDYAYDTNIIDNDITEALCQDLFSFLEKADYVVYTNFEMDDGAIGLSFGLGMAATFECGIFILGTRPHESGSTLSFAIGFAGISED